MNYYFDLDSQSIEYSVEDAVNLIKTAFSMAVFDYEAALEEAKLRLKSLEELDAPEEVIEAYKNSKPVRCTIALDTEEAALEFDIWDNQGILAYPIPGDKYKELEPLVQNLAECLGFEYSLEETD